MSTLWPQLLPPSQWSDDELCVVAARGTRLHTVDGTELLDADSGLWNVNLGHGDPVIAAAVHEALLAASYAGTFRWTSTYARAAAGALVDVVGRADARVLFSTSGGAANDLAEKLARHHHALRGEPQRRVVVGLQGSYHGMTFGAFALTGEDLGQDLYGADRRLVHHLPPDDVDALEHHLARVGRQVAAVVVEPVLGTGTRPLSPEYVTALLQGRDEHGFLLVADEVATGFGRTGPLLASSAWPAPPDVVLLSKGLTNGVAAAAAVVCAPHVVRPFVQHDSVLVHAETQAGTAPTCAAVLATLQRFDELDALARGRRVGELLGAGLDALVREEPAALGHVGTGCFRTLRVAGPDGGPLPGHEVPALVAEIRRAGVVVHPAPDGVQLVPALTSSDDDVATALDAVRRVLHARRPATERALVGEATR